MWSTHSSTGGVDRPPLRPWHETVIYELHVKGFTKTNADILEELLGTYAGIAHPASIAHLVSLNVSAVELMPVHQFAHSDRLTNLGLSNYWGYDAIGFFSPHNEYSSTGQTSQQVNEFKSRVKALHQAGIEMILDVVYNHTAEGGHLGRRSHSVDWTMPPITGLIRMIHSATSIIRGPAIPSTCGIRTCSR